eukprot:2415930-Rhodomonas_salina.1
MDHVKQLVDEGLEWGLEREPSSCYFPKLRTHPARVRTGLVSKVDCTSYKDQVRQTHNGEGPADPAE